LTNPKPPSHLSKTSAAFFKKFVSEYECEDLHVEVLTRVCESMDRASQAALGLKNHGSLVTLDRFGIEKAHPLVQVERQASRAVIDGLKSLGVLKQEKTTDRYSKKVFG
jgi:phage terminase small subunit